VRVALDWAPAPSASTERRSGPSRFGRGFLLFAAITVAACSTSAPDDQPSATAPLVIGVSEGSGQGPEFGLENLVDQITTETLTTTGIDGRAQPSLAKSWSWERDEMQLRVRLREDVFLHDGRRFDSQLAAEVLAIAISRRANRAQYPALSDVTGAIPDGPNELLLELARPSALLPEDLTVVVDVPAGPYRPVPSKEGTIELERFDKYFLGTPSIPRLTLRPFDTLRTAWSTLLRGELDMVYDVPADTIEFIRNDDVQVRAVPRWYQYLVAFNSARGPLRSPMVRRALNLAVNRQALLDQVLNGAGSISTGPIWPRYWAYDSSIQGFTFDPAEADALLTEAGLARYDEGDGENSPPARLRFVCLIPENFSVWEQVALNVQRDLFEIGVDMQFKVVPFSEFNTLIGNGEFDAVMLDAISGPTPSRPFMLWRSARTFQGTYNVFGYENPEAERSFEVLRSSINEAAVRSATRRLQRLMAEDPPALFLAWNERARAMRRNIFVPDSDRPDVMWTLAGWSRQPLGDRALK
jgi:peptide/nickel transport system substrate-binding protein